HSIEPANKNQSIKNNALPGKYYLCCFDIEGQEQSWKTEVQGLIRGEPVAVGDTILTGTVEGMLYALDRKTGKITWTFDTKSKFALPVVDNGVVYVTGEKELLAIDLASGRKLWGVSPKKFSPTDVPVIFNSVVYMVAQDSNLYAIKTDPPATAAKNKEAE
ncbi:MAG: PQQ-like beta-propeller repeat protein, partial [Cyanobacteria bacterium]|nr:PQQ-like beta-propeller repeat protein [Cyanobacteriota bacterium]